MLQHTPNSLSGSPQVKRRDPPRFFAAEGRATLHAELRHGSNHASTKQVNLPKHPAESRFSPATPGQNGPMHILVGRGGELAAPFGPVCGDTDRICHHGLAGLNSRCPVDHITVANHPDMTVTKLTAACADFLGRRRMGGRRRRNCRLHGRRRRPDRRKISGRHQATGQLRPRCR